MEARWLCWSVIGLLVLGPGLAAQDNCKPEQVEIAAPDGAMWDYFGWACALEGDTAVVGARTDDSAHVFTRSGTVWSHVQKLMPSSSTASFGDALEISGDTLVVGAMHDSDLGTSAGAAFVFRRGASGWEEEAKLLASDGAETNWFGDVVAIEGNTIVVGARGWPTGTQLGAVYVFTWDGTVWSEQAKLVASDGDPTDWFGRSVAIAGDWIAVGANGDDDVCNNIEGCQAGAVYMFRRNGSSWTEMQKFRPSDQTAGDQFGVAVALWDDYLVAGARFDDTIYGNSGSAWVLRRNGLQWEEHTQLLPRLSPDDDFGWSVDIDAGTIVVGARFDDEPGSNRGAVYTFPSCAGSWHDSTKIFPCHLYLDAAFGTSVSISGDSLLVGAPQDVGAAVSSGAAFVYLVPPLRALDVYCTAKPNSCGTLPAIAGSGTPSASAGSGFVVSAGGTGGQKNGLLIYTDQGSASLPFEGGLLCVSPTNLHRSVPLLDTSGTLGQCDGTLAIDMNRFAVGALGGSPLPALRVAGTRIYAQFWGRDTPGNSLLSDALMYLICP